jgi:hypothetical protein
MVDAASLTLQQFHDSTPVISFEVTLAANAPPGDYSIRLQSNSGEVAYLAGGITINPTSHNLTIPGVPTVPAF